MYIGAFCKWQSFHLVCLLEQRADILHEVFQHQYLLVPTVLQLSSQVNLSLIKAVFPVFKHVYNFKPRFKRPRQMDNWK